METTDQHTERYAEWIIKCFATENMVLDYSPESLKNLDKFLSDNVTNGVPNPAGILRKDHDTILYGMGIYLGETFKKNLPGAKWVTSNNNGTDFLTGEFLLANGSCIYPMERVQKRFENGEEDAIYPYGHIVITQMAKEGYWENLKHNDTKSPAKPWWKIW